MTGNHQRVTATVLLRPPQCQRHLFEEALLDSGGDGGAGAAGAAAHGRGGWLTIAGRLWRETRFVLSTRLLAMVVKPRRQPHRPQLHHQHLAAAVLLQVPQAARLLRLLRMPPAHLAESPSLDRRYQHQTRGTQWRAAASWLHLGVPQLLSLADCASA